MQYTIRDIPKELDKALRAKAKAEGKSLNQVTIESMKMAMGIGNGSLKRRDLSDLAGTWVADPEFDKAIADQDQIDPEMWE